ncbi:LOW QUALITY PROTEIN: uncharacterized protein O8D03_016061 [Erethizon dorsatum]
MSAARVSGFRHLVRFGARLFLLKPPGATSPGKSRSPNEGCDDGAGVGGALAEMPSVRAVLGDFCDVQHWAPNICEDMVPPGTFDTWGSEGSHSREMLGPWPSKPIQAGRGEQCYRSTELMITWILRVYTGQALSLNSRELPLLGDLTHTTIFTYHCESLWGSCQTLLTWLLKAWHPCWGSLLHVYPGYDMPLTQVLQQHLLLKEVTVQEAMRVIHMLTDVGLLCHQSQLGHTKLMLGPSPTCKDIMGWLLSHSMPQERVDKWPIRVLVELYIRDPAQSQAPGPARRGTICRTQLALEDRGVPRVEFRGDGQGAWAVVGEAEALPWHLPCVLIPSYFHIRHCPEPVRE